MQGGLCGAGVKGSPPLGAVLCGVLGRDGSQRIAVERGVGVRGAAGALLLCVPGNSRGAAGKGGRHWSELVGKHWGCWAGRGEAGSPLARALCPAQLR